MTWKCELVVQQPVSVSPLGRSFIVEGSLNDEEMLLFLKNAAARRVVSCLIAVVCDEAEAESPLTLHLADET